VVLHDASILLGRTPAPVHDQSATHLVTTFSLRYSRTTKTFWYVSVSNPDTCLRLEHHHYQVVPRLWKYRACVIPGPIQLVILTPSLTESVAYVAWRRLPGTTRSGRREISVPPPV